MTPGIRLTAPVLGTPDAPPASLQGPALSERSVGGRDVLLLSFRLERDHVPPVPGTRQMQQHLDSQVGDLDAASAVAEEAGARLLNTCTEPHEVVRTYADPDGHVFCLFVPVPVVAQ